MAVVVKGVIVILLTRVFLTMHRSISSFKLLMSNSYRRRHAMCCDGYTQLSRIWCSCKCLVSTPLFTHSVESFNKLNGLISI